MTTKTVFWLGLMLLVPAMAGCLGGDDGASQSTDSPSPSDSGSPDPSMTGSPFPSPPGGNGSNEAPVAAFEVLDNGTVLDEENGSVSASADVNLTFDASASEDPDGDELTYSWTFGEDVADGAIVNRSFEPGEILVVLTVEDEGGATASANVTLNVTAGGAGDYLFFDGGEEPAEWEFSEEIIISANAGGPVPEPHIEQDHPFAAGWHTTEAQAFSGTASWTLADEDAGGYHDHEYVTMTSPAIDLSGVSAATFSFVYVGDTEDNGFDGMHWQVSGDGGENWEELGFDAGLVEQWTPVEHDVSSYAGGELMIRFLFKSDGSCSQDTDQVSDVCGAGEYLGYWVDEIALAGA
jgi:hypothetical protein